MAVDEAGHQHPLAQVQHLCLGIFLPQLSLRSHLGNFSVAYQNGHVLYAPQLPAAQGRLGGDQPVRHS